MVKACYDCQEDFVLASEETEWYHEHELSEPERCQECRDIRREITDQTVQCFICQTEFTWSADMQRALRTYKGPDNDIVPRICLECQDKLNGLVEQTLYCNWCYSSFVFTPIQQLVYKEREWTTLSRCEDCREKEKSGKPLAMDLYNARGDLVGHSYRQGNKTKRYNLRGELTDYWIHSQKQSARYNARGKLIGRSYQKNGHSEYYNSKGDLTSRTYHYKGYSEHYDGLGKKIGWSRIA